MGLNGHLRADGFYNTNHFFKYGYNIIQTFDAVILTFGPLNQINEIINSNTLSLYIKAKFLWQKK